MLGYAALVLRLLGKERRDEVAHILCKALQVSKVCTFALPETLMDVLFPEPRPPQGRKVEEFDDVQLGSMNLLLQTAHWRDWMIESRFLPRGLTGNHYRNALRRFVTDVTGRESVFDADFLGRAGNVSSWDLEKHWP